MDGLIFPAGPIATDETRALEYFGLGTLYMTLKCFVRPPEPPEFRTCAECSFVHELEYGDHFVVKVPEILRSSGSGQLIFHLWNEYGEENEVTLEVYRSQSEGPQQVGAY